MAKKINKWLYWTPRVLSIIFLLFLAMFSLDIFDGNYGFWGTIVGLFMHNIPVFILAIILFYSWKREIIGGIVFISAGMLYVGRLLMVILTNTPREWYMLFWSLPIAGPAFLIGILFLINWYQKRKPRTS
jgi:uncharacterized membrane protein YgdD (TMEM256/DUF423 family)